MAIQNRRGNYNDFDPQKMLPGEWAIVLANDPNSTTGTAIYMCFGAGDVRRMSTYDEIVENINLATLDIQKKLTSQVQSAVQSANTATSNANSAGAKATTAAKSAEDATRKLLDAVTGVIDDAHSTNLTTYSSQKLDKDFLRKNGDASSVMVKYAIPQRIENLLPGETLEKAMAKIAKIINDIKAHALSLPVNDVVSTSTTLALSAKMGKVLMDEITNINNALKNYYDKTSVDATVGGLMPKTGGEFTGSVTFGQQMNCNNAVVVSDGQQVRWNNGAGMNSSGPQHLYLFGSQEASYYVHLGVHDAKWTLDPDVDGCLALGTANHKWTDIYANNGTIQTSDRNRKNTILPISDKYLSFYEQLQPITFKFNDGTSGRTHVGFISQDVEKAMQSAGLTDLEFAGFCKNRKTQRVEVAEQVNVVNEKGETVKQTVVRHEDKLVPNEYTYSLRYDEFIALNTAMIQKLMKRIDVLEKELNSLKNPM